MAGFVRRKGEEYVSALGWNKAYDFLFEYTPARLNLLFNFLSRFKRNDWLNWLENNLLGTYEKRQRLDCSWHKLVQRRQT